MEKIGRYQIAAELGKGAMGVVYKATDPNIGRTVSVKTLRFDVLGMDGEEMLQRFKNEARAAGAMNHPNIITIYDAGEHEGMFYIAMEYIEGQALQDLLKQEKTLPLEKIIEIVRQVCAGLDYAHSRGIIHRDVKPANIMMQIDGTVKIMDFGVAKGGGSGMTSAGQVVGTPNYMSPEQVKGKPLDGRSDLFSLGVVLYEMITGERPFADQNVTTIIYKIVNETPTAPCDLNASVHPGLNAVVMKALAKAPEQRYASGAELARDLQNYQSLDTAGVVAPAPIVRPVASASDVVQVPTSAQPAALAAAATKPAQPMLPVLDTTVVAPPRAAVRPSPPPKRSGPLIAIVAAAVVVVALALGAYLRSRRAPPAANAESATPAASTLQGKPPAGAPPRSHANGVAGAPAQLPGKAATAAGLGDLQISSTPFGARVTIDGRSNPDWQTPFAARRLASGRHAVRFSLKGYQPETRPVEVVAGQKLPLVVQLQVAYGYVALSSDPAGATIYVDGRDSGQQTPARLTLNEGQHRIALRKEGYKPQITYAEVTSGKTFNFAPALAPVSGAAPATPTNVASSQGTSPFHRLRRLFGKPRADDGVLEVRTRPKGAGIWLGEMQAPSRTPAKLAVAPGSYKITLRLPGYKPITRSVTIEKGKMMGVEEIFEPQ